MQLAVTIIGVILNQIVLLLQINEFFQLNLIVELIELQLFEES